MTSSKIYGTALFVGALGTVLTMIFHPTGADLLQDNPDSARMGELIAILTHSVALFSYPVLSFGFAGLYRFLKGGLLQTAGLISFFFACVMVMIAGTASGLIAPEITSRILAADDAAKPMWHQLLTYNFLVNQAFTKVFVVASSISIVLWSICIGDKGEKFRTITCIAGSLVGATTLIAFFSGHLSLDVHGFGLLAFAQAAVFIMVGVVLFRSKPGN